MKHTIFTPVYNRAGNMFDLAKHISEIDYPKSEFEWLIIDDGSTDNLKDILYQIKDTYTDINIRSIHKENGGIHTAQNCAIKNALGEYITRIDSDDYLLPDCLKNYDMALDSIPSEKRNVIAGVVGLCMNLKDMTVRGTSFPKDSQITKGYLLARKGVTGDKNFCIRTSVMKEFLIPEHEDTKWVPEGGVLWLELDKKYDTLFVNIPISVCTEPNPNSYTGAMKKTTLANVMTSYYGSVYVINHGKGYYSTRTILRAYIKTPLTYICARKYNKKTYSYHRFFNDIMSFPDKFIMCFCIPFAIIYSIIKR